MNKEAFLRLLRQEFESNHRINLLIDHDGLSRVEGYITSIENKSNNNTAIHLDNNEVILLSQIVAVNGVFSTDFSEC